MRNRVPLLSAVFASVLLLAAGCSLPGMEDLENRLTEDIGSLENRMDDIEEMAEGIVEAGSGELADRVAVLENELEVITSVVSTGDGEAPDLSALAGMSADLQTLQETLADQSENLLEATAAIDSLTVRVGELRTEVDSLEADNARLKDDIAYLEDLVEAIDSRGSTGSGTSGRGGSGGSSSGSRGGSTGGDSSSSGGGSSGR